MTLRLEHVLPGLPGLVSRYRERLAAFAGGLGEARSALERWSADPAAGDAEIAAAMAGTSLPYATSFDEAPGTVLAAPPPAPVTVVSADGSSIEPDRFAPVPCYVVNTGFAVLGYGTGVPSTLGAQAEIGPLAFGGEGEDDSGAEEVPIRGWGVNLRRDVCELEATATHAGSFAGPAVVLLDGTLFPWDLDSRQVAEPVRRDLAARTSAALDRLAAAGERLSLGAYISASRSADVVTSLHTLAGKPEVPWPVSDAHLFAGLLGEGERSALFRARSERVQLVESLFRGRHEVVFFYVRFGGDIARVETTAWAASPPRIARLHATLADQCRRCDGYPRALQEAHEQAVIAAADRQQFSRLLEDEAARQGLRPLVNGKQASKRRRGL